VQIFVLTRDDGGALSVFTTPVSLKKKNNSWMNKNKTQLLVLQSEEAIAKNLES